MKERRAHRLNHPCTKGSRPTNAPISPARLSPLPLLYDLPLVVHRSELEIRRHAYQSIGLRPMEADRKSTRLNSSHGYISYAVFCLKKKKKTTAPNASV